MSEMTQGMVTALSSDSAEGADSKRCLVIDATPSVQAWVDEFYRRGINAHPTAGVRVPQGTVVVTVAAVWRGVETAFSRQDDPWTVRKGWPNLENLPPLTGPANPGNPIRRWFCSLFGC